MRTIMFKTFGALALVASMAACDLDVPDLNNPGIDQLADNPTRSSVLAASTGLLIGNRLGYAANNGYVSNLGIIGRESYNFDTADPRYITELLGPQLDPGAGAFGGNFWSLPYANIRSSFTLLHALDKVPGMTDEEKESIRGFALTIQAMEFLTIINTHDENGAPIDVDIALSDIDNLAPIEDKAAVFAHILELLDEAKTHLSAGGEAFPFKLSTGYAGFDTPATFLKFNRAIKARVDVYAGNFDDALVDLGESFLVLDATMLDLGVYHVYSPGSGDALNGLIDPNLYAHPSIVTDADKKVDGTTLDDRVTRKVKTVESRTVGGLTSDLSFEPRYPSSTTPVPIIRNEELILLRAEANIGLNDVAAAADDINFIRVNSGGLEPRADLTAANILDELLKQKRYSLLFEGGHRWIDMRRYDKLDELPIDVAGQTVHSKFPIPQSEQDARQ